LVRPGGTTFNGGNTAGTFGGSNRGNGNNSPNGGGNGGNNSGNAGGGLNFGNPSSRSSALHNAAAQIPEGVTPEVQAVSIEVNRALALKNGDAEGAAILPITDATQ
jgi:hypothetical protein